jgi:cell division septation protein DedD
MTFKDDVRNKTGAVLTRSQEIFEKIFVQATREFSIRRKPKPAAQKPSATPASATPRLTKEPAKSAKTSEKTVTPTKTAEKFKAGSRPKPKAKASSRKGSRVLRASLLLVLLLVLAGYAANYFAVIDLTVIPDLLGLGPKQVVQAPIPRRQPAKPPEKAVSAPKQPQEQESVPTPSPAQSVPTPPALSKEEKLVEIETPTTVVPLETAKQPAEGKVPLTPAPDQPKPAEVTAKKEPQPLPAQSEVLEKPSVPPVAPSKPGTLQYPYSVYLGSFKAPDAVKKALSDYQEKGISAYWARVDLGDKGVWFRFFTGYFRTKEEAEKYVRESNIQGATPGITKYANLIGSYGSDKEAEDQKRTIVSAGFYPYIIKGTDGKSLVYSGAFDRKEYAEKERALLASKGIQSTVVAR